MLAIFDDMDMSGLLAVWYVDKFTQHTVLGGVGVFMLSSHSCRRSLFVRKVLEITSKQFQRTNDLRNLSRLAHIYLNLALENAQYRHEYAATMRNFFNRLPERRPVLSCTLHETRYWAGAGRQMDALILGSRMMRVLGTHFTRGRSGGLWSCNAAGGDEVHDLHTFECGITSLIACVSVIDRQAVLPCVMCIDFALNVTDVIMDNNKFCEAHSDLFIPSTQLLALFCPASRVQIVLDRIIQQFCDFVVDQEQSSAHGSSFHLSIQGASRCDLLENALQLSIEHVTSRPDLSKTLENYFALNPCLFKVISAGIALAIQQQLGMCALHVETPLVSQHARIRAQTHMNVCSLAHNILKRCIHITEDEVSHILCYVDHLAKAELLGILCFNVVLLLAKVVFTYSDGAFLMRPAPLQHLLMLLQDAVKLTGTRMCSEEIILSVGECIVCILAKQQTQLSCVGWDTISGICCQQLGFRKLHGTPCVDRLLESLIVCARHTSLAAFEILVSSMKGIYESFGGVASMSSRKRRQFVDLLKIPLCRGVVFPKAQMQLQFHNLGIVRHTESLATLFMRLENKSGRHTSSMISIAQTLFLLILFQEVGYPTKDLTLRLCAKIISAVNIRDGHRSRMHTMIVELLGRYHHSVTPNLLLSASPSVPPCSMDPSLIRHLVSTLLPAPKDINYTEVPLQLCIISSLLSHGKLLCLCERRHAMGGKDVKACSDIYVFCLQVLGNINSMSVTAVHRHGLLLAQRIIHRLLRSPFHGHSPLATLHMNKVLLTHIAAMQVLLLVQPKTFPESAYANGLSDNEAIRTLLQRCLILSKCA